MCLNIGVGSLIRRLGVNSKPTIREQAIQDLVKIGGLAIEQLSEALNHSDPYIRKGATEALKRIKEG